MSASHAQALVIAILCGAAAVGVIWFGRSWARRAARRSVRRHGARIDRYKLVRKTQIIDTLLRDSAIADALRSHAAEKGESESTSQRRVRGYLDEIVPFFSILAYYKVGYALSKAVLGVFYRVTVAYDPPDPFRGLPRDAIVIYLINHRSNADYVLVAYALAGEVSLSYAVGEWARAFPLEYIFKSFGSYFIRRRYREVLYHTVLSRYVQLITRNAVTQGIFPEGGLTRDGTIRPAKIGLLDYALSVARDPADRRRMFVVPVGLNYDRVLEDRSLLRELASNEGRERPSRLRQLGEVAHYAMFNVGRMVTGRWKRYGRAAVTIGAPRSVDAWLTSLELRGIRPLDLPRESRLPLVQEFCDDAMTAIGQLVPVTPVPLTCAALQTFDSDFVTRHQLVARMEELRRVLPSSATHHLPGERTTEDVLDLAYRMLRMRRVVARQGGGFAILPRGRPLISYYANSVAHLLGPFTAGIRERDALHEVTTLAW